MKFYLFFIIFIQFSFIFSYNNNKFNLLSTKLYSIKSINRNDFTILNNNDNNLIFLDSAASSLKPLPVINKYMEYYTKYPVNIHRSSYPLSREATNKYEEARQKIGNFISTDSKNIIFTSSATNSINLISKLLNKNYFNDNDEIILSSLEHHSNIIPWQILEKLNKIKIKYIKLTNNYEIDLENLKNLITSKTKLISISHISNVIGILNPIEKIINIIKYYNNLYNNNIKILLDASQSLGHLSIDVNKLDIDLLIGSGHKLGSPTGIGFIYNKNNFLQEYEPDFGGGEMVDTVTFQSSSYAKSPLKFEPGTPPIAQAIGLGYACEYLQSIGIDKISEHNKLLSKYLIKKLSKIKNIEIIGEKESERYGIISFYHRNIHSNDLSLLLNENNVCIRGGSHCAQPLHSLLPVTSTLRVSCHYYNNSDDIDKFCQLLQEKINILE